MTGRRGGWDAGMAFPRAFAPVGYRSPSKTTAARLVSHYNPARVGCHSGRTDANDSAGIVFAAALPEPTPPRVAGAASRDCGVASARGG